MSMGCGEIYFSNNAQYFEDAKNVASVRVHAELTALTGPREHFDIQVNTQTSTSLVHHLRAS